MTWITENPIPPIVLAILVEAGLAVALAKTGKRWIIWAMPGVALLAIGAVVAERMIVTPREEVIGAVEEVRKIVEANDRAALLERIDHAAVRNQVQTDLSSSVTVTEAKINDLRVLVDEAGTSATTDFIGVVHLQGFMRENLALRFKVTWRKRQEDGVWVVTSAEYKQPFGNNSAS